MQPPAHKTRACPCSKHIFLLVDMQIPAIWRTTLDAFDQFSLNVKRPVLCGNCKTNDSGKIMFWMLEPIDWGYWLLVKIIILQYFSIIVYFFISLRKSIFTDIPLIGSSRQYYLLHDLGELRTENLTAGFIKNLVKHYVLKGHKSCFEHVKPSLVCKGEHRRCLQLHLCQLDYLPFTRMTRTSENYD